MMLMFLCCFSHVLIVTDDSELDMDRPLPMHQIRRCILMLKKLLHRAFFTDKDTSDLKADSTTTTAISNYFGLALIAAASRTMRDLYDRSSRKPMCVPSLWVISGLMHKEINQCRTTSDYQSLVDSSQILRVCPYLVPFKRRLKLFDRLITTSRVQIQGENSVNPFHNNPLKPGIPVRITRGRILEDGLATMNNLGSNMRQRIAVQYYNEAGVRETGIDAGGLFKDFWTDVSISRFVCQWTKMTYQHHKSYPFYENLSYAPSHSTSIMLFFELPKLGTILQLLELETVYTPTLALPPHMDLIIRHFLPFLAEFSAKLCTKE
jgi:ubiquitin-protein ligase E3 C